MVTGSKFLFQSIILQEESEMAFKTNAGTMLYVSAALPTTNDETGFSALTWTQVKEVESIVPPSDAFSDVTFTSLEDNMTRHVKGVNDPTALTASLGYDSADAGQNILFTALSSKNAYSFKIAYDDDENRYCQGRVFELTDSGGTNSDVVKLSLSVRLTEPPVRVTP
jgi:hypothetical protein